MFDMKGRIHVIVNDSGDTDSEPSGDENVNDEEEDKEDDKAEYSDIEENELFKHT